MPSYIVTSPGFYNGILHRPGDSKHSILRASKPFKKGEAPSWIDPKPLTEAQAEEAVETANKAPEIEDPGVGSKVPKAPKGSKNIVEIDDGVEIL